jgi:hypothetical protein
MVGVVCCSSCASPSAPTSDEPTLYELRVAESPICPTLTAFPQGTARYGFFMFGLVTVHVKGSFATGTFLLVDDSLATFAPECVGRSRPTLQLPRSSVAGGSLAGQIDGVWFPRGCPGNYLGAEGTVSGTRDATSASGLLNGTLSNGIYALNYSGSCPAPDHAWSLRPAQ